MEDGETAAAVESPAAAAASSASEAVASPRSAPRPPHPPLRKDLPLFVRWALQSSIQHLAKSQESFGGSSGWRLGSGVEGGG